MNEQKEHAEKIFNGIAQENMIRWDLAGFKSKYSNLHRTILQAMILYADEMQGEKKKPPKKDKE